MALVAVLGLATPVAAQTVPCVDNTAARLGSDKPMGCGGYGGGNAPGQTPSSGGVSQDDGTGIAGQAGAAGGAYSGGGGGGAGVSGGVGGDAFGSASGGGLGGAAGAVPSADGLAGGAGTNGYGGGGGGGGAHGASVSASASNSSGNVILGGAGGAGGAGLSNSGGGGGGAGGYGVAITGSGITYSNAGEIRGGAGGAGGNSQTGSVGEGGWGGNGLFVQDGTGDGITNSGIISGGVGGASGISSSTKAYPEGGDGGNGVVFSNSHGTMLTNSGVISGGTGGANISTGDRWDHLGGDGGAGVLGEGFSVTNSGSITGGNGGNGGGGGYFKNADGGAGISDVGDGTAVTVITNSGTIQGGRGGNGAPLDNPRSVDVSTEPDKGRALPGRGVGDIAGNGGIGITGSSLTIINAAGAAILGGDGGTPLVSSATASWGSEGIAGSSLAVLTAGTISGGAGSDGIRANAISFIGGASYLELRPGFVINGNAVVQAGTGKFGLGGAGSASFDVSSLGVAGSSQQYQNFTAFVKTGSSTWSLTGAPNTLTPWTIEQGVLQISANTSLGVNGETLTFSGTDASLPPTLRFAAPDITVTRDVLLATDGTFDTSGNAATLSGALTGAGGLIKIGAGVLTLEGTSNSYSGDTVVRQGVLMAGATNAFSAVSVHRVESGAEINLAGHDQEVAGVNNAGLIVTNGAGPGTRLTVNGNYVGAGGTLQLNTFLGSDGSPSDQLVINGGTASGSSALLIDNLRGLGAITVANGILVVDAINGGTTLAGSTFALARPVLAGPFEYTLFRGSVDGSNADAWYLRSTIDCSRSSPVAVCAVTPPPPPPCANCAPGTPTPPNYRPETSLDTAAPALALIYGRNLLDTLHERVGEEEDIRGRGDLHRDGLATGGWVRLLGTDGSHRGDPLGVYGAGPQFSYGLVGIQGGQDMIRHEAGDGSRDHAGVTFAVGNAHGDVLHVDGTKGDDDLQAYTLGGYWTHFGAQGWYVDSMVQGTIYDVRTSANRGLEPFRTTAGGIAGSLETGIPVSFASGYFIEPQAQLIYQNINFNSALDNGGRVAFSNVDSMIGRVGARFGRTFAIDGSAAQDRLLTVWIRPNFWHEFRGVPITQFASSDSPVVFRECLGGSWGEINLGVSGQLDRSTTLFLNASYESRFDAGGHAYSGKGGVRLNW